MKRTIPLLVTAATLPLMMSLSAQATPREPGHHFKPACHPPMELMSTLHQLDLSTEQKAQLYDLQGQHFARPDKPHFKKTEQAKKGPRPHPKNYASELNALVMSDHFSTDKVKALAAKMDQSRQHRAQFRAHRMEQHLVAEAQWMHQQIAVLTDTQKATLKQKLADNRCFNGPMPPMNAPQQ